MNIKLFVKYLFSKDDDDAAVTAFCWSLVISIFALLISITGLIISFV